MRALARSPLAAAVVGGAVVAVTLVALGVSGRSSTTTIVQQATMAGETLPPSASPSTDALTVHDIYTRAAPGVVYVRAPDGETGTAFCIDDAGHLLTNQHVVGDAETVRVRFGEHRGATATVLGRDPSDDLALLKLQAGAEKLPALPLGSSAAARVGDTVVAIGNPYGLQRTLATGVVSALGRQLLASNGFTIGQAIQTDAAIQPGSSGGPLLDTSGRVIGIATRGNDGGAAGIGFAVPIDTAKQRLKELKKTGSVRHAWLGVTAVTIDDRLATVQLRTKAGVLVQTVTPGSPAQAAGLRGGSIESQADGETLLLGGDVITSLDGVTVRSVEQLTDAIDTLKPGRRVRLGVLRGKQSLELRLTLGTAPARAP
ncbi:trypsin-like peptidase domain-containing protein [Conexibacter sp. JD483]|uniref:S1C family serine protease n=1 Tax=unclassified Conexibacter TaxID=2627773 RepID=UPI00271996E3|nr:MULTISPECIES: trypsin-like peptidase domain-containing protein [unclassified Conexibacter]MDO8184808.1 trypsin-like peptidase domain-containing protein [Conexibacter sp. CPCC 205706]MDO8196583.1 trypsin-like peptidase domain-containing protein [Conexibacter sp. CPCC 205762]MDR9368704.1 trypsin-like peptidase domain-containing protein [Conexibacter sp. JD483]